MLVNPAQVRACQLVVEALAFIKPQIKPGFTERQLARKIRKHLFDNGAQKLAFPIIVAAGKNSATPHHWPTAKKIQGSDIVLIDIGCVVKNQRSDITRTFLVGKPKTDWLTTYRQVLKAQEKALKALKVKTIKAFDLDAVARNYFKRLKKDKYFIHGLGHGIGQWIHQNPKIKPNSKHTIKPGDVITIEPGLYFKNRFGVRIENTVVKTNRGFKYLTQFPKDLSSAKLH